MNIERALNIYRTYTVAKIASLDKQNLAMQYAQCGELVKLQKEKEAYYKKVRQEKASALATAEELKQEIEKFKQQETKLIEDYECIKRELNDNDSEWTKEIESISSLLPQEAEVKNELKFDSLIADAAYLIVICQQGTTSMIQRRFSIGYNRASSLMDQLEVLGVVGQANGSKPREVLIKSEDVLKEQLKKVHIQE